MAYGSLAIDQITNSVTGSSLGAGNASIMKNRIINGAMVINQRGFSGSVDNSNPFTFDRWRAFSINSSKYSVSQNAGSVTPPVGFVNYLGVTSLAATSSGATDFYGLAQPIEGFNTADLAWGTANAKTITLSFWVYSSLTGTFAGSLLNSAALRSYPFTYSISSANTWQQISVTVAGDTTGTWATGNTTGILLVFNLGYGSTYSGTANTWQAGGYYNATGSTSIVATNGATWYVTGVQLEVGSSATGFEYRQYGQELALCQRYLPVTTTLTDTTVGSVGDGFIYNASNINCTTPFMVAPRAAPTGISVTGATYCIVNHPAGNGTVTGATYGGASLTTGLINWTATGVTNGQPCRILNTGTNTQTTKILWTGSEL